MPSASPCRLAAGLLLIFAASHTLGGLLFPPSNGIAADAVLTSMKTTHFDFHGSDCTYYRFQMGFGLMVSVFLVLSAGIAWTLGNARLLRNPAMKEALKPVAWLLLLSHVGTAILSWRFFFAGPGVISSLVVLLLAWDCVKIFR